MLALLIDAECCESSGVKTDHFETAHVSEILLACDFSIFITFCLTLSVLLDLLKFAQ